MTKNVVRNPVRFVDMFLSAQDDLRPDSQPLKQHTLKNGKDNSQNHSDTPPLSPKSHQK